MKVMVTATGPDLAAAVDPRFGRARWFLLCEEDGSAVRALENNAGVEAAQGAGVQAAQRVVASGAGALLTGRCGPKARQVLATAGLQVYAGVSGPVAAALACWRRGELPLAADAEGKPAP